MTEYYTVKEGRAVPIEPKAPERIPPSGESVLVLPKKGLFGQERRIAIYPTNSPNPFPLSNPVKISPDSLSVADLQNLQGPYISGLVKRALGLEEPEFKTKDWIMLAICGGSLVISGATLWLCVEIAQRFNVI